MSDHGGRHRAQARHPGQPQRPAAHPADGRGSAHLPAGPAPGKEYRSPHQRRGRSWHERRRQGCRQVGGEVDMLMLVI